MKHFKTEKAMRANIEKYCKKQEDHEKTVEEMQVDLTEWWGNKQQIW